MLSGVAVARLSPSRLRVLISGAGLVFLLATSCCAFRLAGIPFAVTPYFWIGSAIFGANAAHGPNGMLLLAVWVACVFVSIVLHELGHALAARRFGVTPYVVLYQMGGATYLPGGIASRVERIFVSLAGPAAGF